MRQLIAFGLDRIDPDKHIKIHLIEAAQRILPALPERLSTAAQKLLEGLQVEIHTSALVAQVLPNGVRLASGRFIAAELVVWAAGVKAPDVLKTLAGLETNRLNQLVVLPTLATTRDPNIFAIGDCAACPWPGHDGSAMPAIASGWTQPGWTAPALAAGGAKGNILCTEDSKTRGRNSGSASAVDSALCSIYSISSS